MDAEGDFRLSDSTQLISENYKLIILRKLIENVKKSKEIENADRSGYEKKNKSSAIA